MRVCILNDNYYRSSGITKAMERLTSSPAFRQVDVYLAGCNTVQGTKVAPETQGIVPEDRYRTFNLMQPASMLPELLRFVLWLKEIRCELLHVQHRRLAVIVDRLACLTGVPVLFTCHLAFDNAAWFRRWAPRHQTGVSASVVEYLRGATRVEDVRLIYNPHEFPAQAPHRAQGLPMRVVSAGRLEAVKGHASLIEAWSQLKQQGVTASLDIIGEGPLRTSLSELIAARGLASQVRLLGFVDDLDQRLGTYGFNVLVSEREGFPNVVVEAAARGLPSLVTGVAGSRDTLPPHLKLANGLEYGDVESLAKALCTWSTAPEAVAEDGQRFFDHLRQLCDKRVIGERYVGLYREQIEKARGSRRMA